MLVDDADGLYALLEPLNLLQEKPQRWWPNSGSVEVVIGAILTQNSQWSKVEHSLKNLKNANLDTLEALSQCDSCDLEYLIKPSGLYKTKAKYLTLLARNILEQFGDFETFCLEVDRAYLLAQKGIGFESADAILCYACLREDVMVVDTYTARLLKALGYEFEDYHELQSWFLSTYSDEQGFFARYHGMIVEYCKVNSKGKMVMIESLFQKGKQ